MLRFNSLRNKNNEEFTRKVGIPYNCFMILLARIKNEISTTLLSNKLKRRGRKSSMIIEDKLLLTLYYLRHYPTFDNLGDLCNISNHGWLRSSRSMTNFYRFNSFSSRENYFLQD